jgi:methyl coenzyme M reductase subunit D
MIKFSKILLREEQLSQQQFQRMNRINKISDKISINTYDFIINQFSKYGINVTDKRKLKMAIDDTISSEIVIDI